jgi:hypothetical protein
MRTGHCKQSARSALAAVFCGLLLSACAATPGEPARLQSFTTDRCSMFPDRALIGTADWCTCCVAHDMAYWQGGTEQDRLRADEALKHCVQASTGDAALAELMFAGVRMGGGPYFYTPYRWGYGWPYGRGYAPLTADESAQATELRAQYMAQHPVLACTTRADRTPLIHGAEAASEPASSASPLEPNTAPSIAP